MLLLSQMTFVSSMVVLAFFSETGFSMWVKDNYAKRQAKIREKEIKLLIELRKKYPDV